MAKEERHYVNISSLIYLRHCLASTLPPLCRLVCRPPENQFVCRTVPGSSDGGRGLEGRPTARGGVPAQGLHRASPALHQPDPHPRGVVHHRHPPGLPSRHAGLLQGSAAEVPCGLLRAAPPRSACLLSSLSHLVLAKTRASCACRAVAAFSFSQSLGLFETML